jgi:anti-sigma regulatory factor (Ser/Thr protein kinase)
MGTVSLQLPAEPGHVAVARAVATALARRLELPDELVEEVRLAVGEACARAVAVQALADADVPVQVRLEHDEEFVAAVEDSAGSGAVPPAADHDDLFGVDLAEGLGIAVLRGLVDDLEVSDTGTGTRIRMSWPLPSRS